MSDLTIEPAVLKWARKTGIGLSTEALSAQLTKHWEEARLDMIIQWEEGENNPTFEEVKKLSEIYKRPLAVFFLKTPPNEPSNPPDKRTIGSKDHKVLSPQGLLIFRKARRVQRISKDLVEELGEVAWFKYANFSTKNSAEALAKRIRKDFDIEISKQVKARNYSEFFEMVRAKIEATGVITLTTGAYDKLPIEDARAFSFADQLPYLILINSKDTEGAKNFSLLHEFAHILLRDDAICNNFKSYTGSNKTEAFCNRFAASFLVPKDDFLSHKLILGKNSIDPATLDTLASDLAFDFKVSRFVILRRLLSFGLIDNATYARVADAWSDEIPQKKKIRATFSVKSYMTKNGKRFSSLVIDAYRNRKISRTRVSDYLGFKSKHLDKFEKLFK